MTLKAVFFDLDGTLLDTSEDLSNALNKTREIHNLPPLAHQLIRGHVSNGARALIKLGFGDSIAPEQLEQYRNELLCQYLERIAEKTKPFNGIPELLEQLFAAGVAWGIVTNKPRLYTNTLMTQLHFPYPPVAVVSPEDAGIAKPDPKPLIHACALAQCSPSNAIYIGDHIRDIECANNAKMRSIAVGYGFTEHPEEHLHWNATHAVDHAHEIWPIIATYLK